MLNDRNKIAKELQELTMMMLNNLSDSKAVKLWSSQIQKQTDNIVELADSKTTLTSKIVRLKYLNTKH